jgi:hypothetical protein
MMGCMRVTIISKMWLSRVHSAYLEQVGFSHTSPPSGNDDIRLIDTLLQERLLRFQPATSTMSFQVVD